MYVCTYVHVMYCTYSVCNMCLLSNRAETYDVVYVCTYIHMCVCVRVRARVCVCVCVYQDVRMYVNIHRCMCVLFRCMFAVVFIHTPCCYVYICTYV